MGRLAQCRVWTSPPWPRRSRRALTGEVAGRGALCALRSVVCDWRLKSARAWGLCAVDVTQFFDVSPALIYGESVPSSSVAIEPSSTETRYCDDQRPWDQPHRLPLESAQQI